MVQSYQPRAAWASTERIENHRSAVEIVTLRQRGRTIDRVPRIGDAGERAAVGGGVQPRGKPAIDRIDKRFEQRRIGGGERVA
ncbi:MAG: hypothetical protein K8H87_17990, partial [Pseudorhodoplanes sp.]|nr:hypothetical protein [Pseudorhodoplanes sp.]